jgi:hypothetical protein
MTNRTGRKFGRGNESSEVNESRESSELLSLDEADHPATPHSAGIVRRRLAAPTGADSWPPKSQPSSQRQDPQRIDQRIDQEQTADQQHEPRPDSPSPPPSPETPQTRQLAAPSATAAHITGSTTSSALQVRLPSSPGGGVSPTGSVLQTKRYMVFDTQQAAAQEQARIEALGKVRMHPLVTHLTHR